MFLSPVPSIQILPRRLNWWKHHLSHDRIDHANGWNTFRRWNFVRNLTHSKTTWASWLVAMRITSPLSQNQIFLACAFHSLYYNFRFPALRVLKNTKPSSIETGYTERCKARNGQIRFDWLSQKAKLSISLNLVPGDKIQGSIVLLKGAPLNW